MSAISHPASKKCLPRSWRWRHTRLLRSDRSPRAREKARPLWPARDHRALGRARRRGVGRDAALGVVPGMALRQAEHLCPQATFVLPDEDAVVRIRELLSAALYDLAPIVEVRDEGIAWLDLRGVVNPGQSIRAARHRLLKAIGREPRLGLAP